MLKSIKTAVTGFALVSLLSFTALALPVSAVDPPDPCSAAGIAAGGSSSSGALCSKPTSVPTSLTESTPTKPSIFTVVVNILLFVIGAISVIMLIVGGIRYAVSNGDSSQITTAKNTIMYAIVGLIIAFLAYAIVNWILTSLGAAK